MKPTKEQLASVKWWEENSGGFDFLYECESTNEIVFANREGKDGNGMRLRLELDIWKLLAKRPEPEVLETDWLKEGVNVTTPKGIAEVRRVTEDDGVYTSIGNFCRSELSEVKSKWKPEEGEWCEARTSGKWRKVKTLNVDLGNDLMAFYVPVTENGLSRLIWCDNYRPIKTQREEFIEEAKSRIKNMDTDDIILAGKLYDAGCRFDLTEKEGE